MRTSNAMAPTPSLGAPSNATTIKVGAALGSILGLILLSALGYVLLICYRRKRRSTQSTTGDRDETENSMQPHQSKKEYHSEKPWGAPVELDQTSVPAELVGTVVEEPGPGIYVSKPELEATAGIYGLRGVYIKKKSELDAESRARDADRVDS
ncbi:hypothetical protein ANO14919_126780 [Xylariales sp. No.14919]|nr:hypothetical protein ANO14919_126780 [Xylariales sp. No.14919]